MEVEEEKNQETAAEEKKDEAEVSVDSSNRARREFRSRRRQGISSGVQLARGRFASDPGEPGPNEVGRDHETRGRDTRVSPLTDEADCCLSRLSRWLGEASAVLLVQFADERGWCRFLEAANAGRRRFNVAAAKRIVFHAVNCNGSIRPEQHCFRLLPGCDARRLRDARLCG